MLTYFTNSTEMMKIFREYILTKLVVKQKLGTPEFCVYSMMQRRFLRYPAPDNSFLFWKRDGSKLKPIFYPELLMFLKQAVALIRLIHKMWACIRFVEAELGFYMLSEYR